MTRSKQISLIDSFYYVSAIILFVLSIASAYYYKERMFFVDPSFVVFNIANTDSFCFSEYRYGAFITQIFPLLGLKFGLPLNVILFLYSISFYIFYSIAFYLIGVKFKQKEIAILLVVYLTLFISDGYFWPNNEVHQGITWMLIFIGLFLYCQYGIKLKHHCLLIFTAAMAISCHLLVLVPFVFLWLNIGYTLYNQGSRLRQYLTYSLLLLCFALIRYKLSTQGWYDGSKLEGLDNLSLASITNIFSSNQAIFFTQLLITKYWTSILLLSSSIIYCLYSKKLIQLGLSLTFCVIYFSLVCLIFSNTVEPYMLFYIESEWAGLSIIIVFPLIQELKSLKHPYILPIILFTIFLGGQRLFDIYSSSPRFENRLTLLSKHLDLLEENKANKAVFYTGKNPQDKLWLIDWGLPVESLLLSVSKDQKAKTFKYVAGDFKLGEEKNSFYACFNKIPIDSLNSKYFKLDSLAKYKLLEF